MANVKLYPHPDLAAKGGIPVAGEIYSSEDAIRLVGSGIAVRKAPAKPAVAKRSTTPARPAKEG